MATMNPAGTPNDPFTGRQADPVDPVMLRQITKADPFMCFNSIPGILYYLHIYIGGRTEDTNPTPVIPRFHLDCGNQKQATFTRFYTRWLYSGAADPRVARVHPNGSVAFRDAVRDCIFWIRKAVTSRQPVGLDKIRETTKSILTSQSNLPSVTEAHWDQLIQRTEPIERVEQVWVHALPSPSPSNHYQQHPLPFFDATPIIAPPGWTIWKPLTVAHNITYAPTTHIDPILTAPIYTHAMHDFNRYRHSVKGHSELSASDATPATFDLQNPHTASITSARAIRNHIHDNLPNTTAPRRRSQIPPPDPRTHAPALTSLTPIRPRPASTPLNPTITMFDTPTPYIETTPPQDSEDERLDLETYELYEEDKVLNHKFGVSMVSAHSEAQRGVTAGFVGRRIEDFKRMLRKAGKDDGGVGYVGLAAEGVLFNEMDWK